MSDTDQRGSAGILEAQGPGRLGEPLLAAADLPFGAIFEGMLEGVAFVDRDWRFRYLNEAGARNLGGPREQLLGTCVFDHFPDLRTSLAHADFGRAARDGKPRRFEAPLPRADGSARWFEFSLQPTADGMLVLSLDVTERHEAADVETSLRGALESIDLAAITLDVAGRLTFANEAFLRATGWAREDVLGLDFFDAFAPADARVGAREDFRRLVGGGDIDAKRELDVRTRAGARRTLVWSTTALRNAAGAVTGVAAVGDDVTERRAIEKAFRETSRSVSAALNASEDSIAIYRPVLDAAGRFADAEVVFVNAAASEWLPDIDPETARGRRLFELAPQVRASVSELYGAVVESGEAAHVVRESRIAPTTRIMDITVTPFEGGFVHVARDVTELHRTTLELREREEELRRIVGGVDAILAWTSREGGPLTVSPQVERILGWRPAELTTFAQWNALVHPDDLAGCRAAWDAEQDTWDLQYRIRRSDGTYATVADRGRCFAGPGDERGTFGVVVDVSERVAADAARADSDVRLRQIVDGVEAIVAFQAAGGTGLQLSPQIERILGWTPDQVPDFEAWHALVHPDDLPRCLSVWDAEEPTWQLEYRMRRGDGTWAWVLDRGRKVGRSDGSGTFYTIGIIMDATERHRAEEALRESEERLRRTIEGVDAIVGIQEHASAPLICSPQVRQILGVDPAEVSTFEAWRGYVHPDDLPRCLALWEDRPEQWEIEYRMRRPDGREIWVLDRGRRIPREDGLGEGTFGIIVDVTDRHHAAEALRASEEQLRQIVEGVDVMISYQEAEGAPVIISPQTERILGYLPDRMSLFEEWRAAIHPEDLAGCASVWESGVPSWDMEYRMHRADGAWIWVHDRGRRIPRPDGSRGLFAVISDVTRQHEAADRLRASEARFRAMFEENPEAIGVLRPILAPDGRFLDAEFIAANRTTRERWLGGVPVELVPGTRASGLWFTGGEDVRAAVAQVAERGEPWRDQVRTRRDGVEHWSDLSVFPFEDGLAFVGRDITDQKRADLAVRDSEARFRAVTDSAEDAIVTVDDAGLIVGWNPSAERMFGRGASEMAGHSVTVLMPEAPAPHHAGPESRPHAAQPVAGHLRQTEARRADGSTFPVEMSLADWTVNGHRYATAIVRDVTEQREAAMGLAQLAAFQRSVLDSMAEGMVIMGPDGRITSANARAAAMLGIGPSDLPRQTAGLGWDPRRVDGSPMPPEDVPGLRTLRTGESCRDLEMNVGRPDGTRIWLRVNTEPLRDRDGGLIAVVATFADITAERALGEQLRRSQRLEAVGQLAGGVAHDFNNLLAAIRGYGELAIASLPSGAAARPDLEEVLRAADRAGGLTRQLLLFSRREILAPQLVDPAEVIGGLVPMLNQLVGEHIELAATSDSSHGRVLADPGQLEQVIINLVVNARDAMPGGGRIEIATRRVLPSSGAEGGLGGTAMTGGTGLPIGDAMPGTTGDAAATWPAMRIAVSDTGDGIDPQVLPRIFEPFFTTKEAGRGSGMGLATVDGIVGASGGTVSVTSAPGQGTVFTVDLPLVEGDTADGTPDGPDATADGAVEVVPGGAAMPKALGVAGAAPSKVPGVAGAAMPGGRGTVLLVEDDDAVRAVLARMLSSLGWRVEERSSGTAAVDGVVSGEIAEPDLLVTDVRMPGLQGPDLARRLRSGWPALPVLFITGLADEVGAEPDEPWVHVLTKPFDVRQLSGAIDGALGSAR